MLGPRFVAIAVLMSGPAATAEQTLSGEAIPPPAEEFLMDLVREAGLSGVRVTSFERTARRQAELMHELLESVGIPAVRDQYDSIGDAVVDFYQVNRDRLDREALIAGMADVVSAGVEASPERQQMMHVLPTTHYTFDVAPSSVGNADAFIEAILRHAGGDLANYILPGPAERAFHLEVPRTLRTVSGTYGGACGRAGPVSITLRRQPRGYTARYVVSGRAIVLEGVTVDRPTRALLIEAAADEVPRAGALRDGYRALDLDVDGVLCRLERSADQIDPFPGRGQPLIDIR